MGDELLGVVVVLHEGAVLKQCGRLCGGGRLHEDAAAALDAPGSGCRRWGSGGGGGAIERVGQLKDTINDDNTSFSFKARYQYTPDVLFYFAWP